MNPDAPTADTRPDAARFQPLSSFTAEARARVRARFRKEELRRTDLGGMVICEDRDLLYEEAPQAYKDVTQVIGVLLDRGLIRLIATLTPTITYKTRRRP